jgi:transcriptional regulator with XRE-family HTH domain
MTATVGDLLRDWRVRRRLSQLDLSNVATVSARHLSFVETGRSKPSRELVLHLAGHLDVPLRERNVLLHAAGFAPLYPETPLDASDMTPVRDALDTILAGHDPYPAVVVDRRHDLVTANRSATDLFVSRVAPELLDPPVNALRVTLHPDGLARDIVNLPLVLRSDGGELRFFSTIATFGTALDITVAELSIESFFPADAATAAALRA